MPVFALDKSLAFPPVDLAEPDGLVAMGGDLSIERLLLAYRNGIFPWYEGEHILWWCPDPRFVLFPHDLKVNKNTEKLIKRFDENKTTEFNSFTIDKAFKQVIHECKEIKRAGQDGTWITDEVEHAYFRLHQAGYAHSAELWKDDELVGGLYGIRLGNAFFGESMFSKVSNASRITFIKYIRLLKSEGVELIDCQVHTDYLESMGARMIPRNEFIVLLGKVLGK
jgi:leucyl/phenylalanyl-tRNA--protein transferase